MNTIINEIKGRRRMAEDGGDGDDWNDDSQG